MIERVAVPRGVGFGWFYVYEFDIKFVADTGRPLALGGKYVFRKEKLYKIGVSKTFDGVIKRGLDHARTVRNDGVWKRFRFSLIWLLFVPNPYVFEFAVTHCGCGVREFFSESDFKKLVGVITNEL